MKRTKKMAIVSHCILNVNAKVAGLANYASSVKELIDDYQEQEVGFIQLPCPELLYMGLKRWGMTKEQYDTQAYRSHCRQLLVPIIQQIELYLAGGYQIVEVVGVDGSPTCGVNQSCRGYCGGCLEQGTDQKEVWSDEAGIFMEEFQKALAKQHIELSFTAISETKQY